MSTDVQCTKWRRNIAENFNRLSRVHERYRRQTNDRRTADGRAIAYSDTFTFSLETSAVDVLPSFNWAKIHLGLLRLQQQPGPTNQEPGPKWRIIRGAGPRRAPAYFNHCPPQWLTQTASRSLQPFVYGSQMLCCTMYCQWGRKPPKLPLRLGFRHSAGGRPNHSHGQHAQKLVKIARVGREISCAQKKSEYHLHLPGILNEWSFLLHDVIGDWMIPYAATLQR